MARKKIEITLKDGENEWHFEIVKMSAVKLESWIIRAALALTSSGIKVPVGADLKKVGASLIKENIINFIGNLEYDKAMPLLNEMLECCSRVLGNAREKCTLDSVSNYIEDIETLFELRKEAVKLNLGFLREKLDKNSDSQEDPSSTEQ